MNTKTSDEMKALGEKELLSMGLSSGSFVVVTIHTLTT